MKFEELELQEELYRAIEEMGHTNPTPIQEKAIPKALEGGDLMCCAQTGTGKTAAFALPILNRLAQQERAEIRAVVLVPTRELAIQVGRSLMDYGKYLELVTTTIYGGVPFEPQTMMLRHGTDIIVATPGRLKDHIWRGNIDFRNLQFLVLDEADRMLDMGFIDDVRGIVELMPTERQSMLFSATLDGDIRRFSKGLLRDPLRIDVTPPKRSLDEINQFLVRTERGKKLQTLESLIRKHRMERTLIFVRTKSSASRLATHLRGRRYRASAIHGDRSQTERVRALEGFRQGQINFLVATDIAARGIDVQDISHVVNFDLPYTTKDYLHRIGRTARAGRTGMAISLVTAEDSRAIASIERLIGQKLSMEGEEPQARRSPEQEAPAERARSPRSRRPRRRDSRERQSSERTSRARDDDGSQRPDADRPRRPRDTTEQRRADRPRRPRDTTEQRDADRPARRRRRRDTSERPRRVAARVSEEKRLAPLKKQPGLLRKVLNHLMPERA